MSIEDIQKIQAAISRAQAPKLAKARQSQIDEQKRTEEIAGQKKRNEKN